MSAFSLNSFREKLKEVLIDQQNTLIERIADNLEQRLLLMQTGLVTTAASVTEHDLATAEAAQYFLDTKTGLHALFDRSIFLFSVEGKIIAEYPFRPGRRGQDFSYRSYIQETLKTRAPVISEPFQTTKDDKDNVLMLTAPVFSKDGKMIAILSGSIGLTRPGMLGNISKAVIGKTGYLYLVNSSGMLIMHPDKQRLSTPAYQSGTFPFYDKALEGFEGTEEVMEPEGAPALVSYQRVETAGWLLAACYPVDEAFLPFHSLAKTFAYLLVGACVLVISTLWFVTRKLLRPLDVLTEQIRTNSRSGDKISVVQLNATGEIAHLERAYNDLAYRLQEREESLLETSKRYQLITENSTDLITKLTHDGIVTYASPVAESLLGIPDHQIIGRAILEFIHPKDRKQLKYTLEQAASDGEPMSVSYRMRKANHDYIWFETTLRLMPAVGSQSGEILCISRDITQRKMIETYLHDLARHDSLTKLPNRLLLEECVTQAIKNAHREEAGLAILVIDFDRFKNINDTLGHTAGDSLLKIAATRLKGVIRNHDVVSRWGGDEFVILLRNVRNLQVVTDVAERCLSVLQQPFDVDKLPLHISASIGISIFPEGGSDAEGLIKNADTAMYRAKQQGGDTYSIYRSEMNAEAEDKLSMENALHFALERDQLLLHYQPIISAITGKLVGAEALIRWEHPTLGMVPPGRFIPLAEASGLIGKIGDWVMRESCKQLAQWLREGLHPIRLSVNLSGRQFRKDSLVATIQNILLSTHVKPEWLELEITETMLMDDVKRSSAIIDELKALGLKIAVDDFGTGYSSLNYLKRFNVDTLKIDRSFVTEVTANEHDAAIVGATVGIAKSLQMKIVAEGVETLEQMEYMRKQGCDELQGFLFSKPMPAHEFLNFAKANATFIMSLKSAN